ncbi:MAG TPA: hypothetical protein VFB21_12400, partial [Chthonomonadaceae bacterium]|nr:hypothetical protein [Chthonomonadaceae bacterium]
MTASLLRCPNGCVGELSVQEKERQGDRLIHGILVCPTCGSNYPVAEGIAPVGVGKPGEPCVTVEFGGKTETIPFGEIRVYPLGFQNGAEGEPE